MTPGARPPNEKRRPRRSAVPKAADQSDVSEDDTSCSVAQREDAELAAHIAKLVERAERYEPEPWSRLADDERDEVHGYLEKFAAEREARVAEHRQRVISTARVLGRKVARGETTAADASRRLDHVCSALDDTYTTPVALIPWREADELADKEFAAGVREVRRAES
jgi:hypothetical protein